LAAIIDKCRSDLKNGAGSSSLYDLASMIQAIAESCNELVLFTIPQGVGGFANELRDSRAMITIPVLPDDIRQSQAALVKKAVDEAIKSLDTLKQQLCINDNIDYKELMTAAGTLFKWASDLRSERREVTPSRGAAGEE
jgi:hypothetical protein